MLVRGEIACVKAPFLADPLYHPLLSLSVTLMQLLCHVITNICHCQELVDSWEKSQINNRNAYIPPIPPRSTGPV